MWLFTRHGFYSVVRDKADAQFVQVRARIRRDLERLRHFASGTASVEMPEIISTPHADYAYRVVVEQSVWVQIAARLAEDIDYSNYKNQVHGEHDRDDAYMAVWSVMHALQRKRKGKVDS